MSDKELQEFVAAQSLAVVTQKCMSKRWRANESTARSREGQCRRWTRWSECVLE